MRTIFVEKKEISQKNCIFVAESHRQIIKGYKVVRLEGYEVITDQRPLTPKISKPSKPIKQKGKNMTTTALSGLLEYLRGTLTANNMRWVGEHLIEYANKEEAEQLRPYTMQEIDDMLDEAENAFEADDYLTQNEVFHRK